MAENPFTSPLSSDLGAANQRDDSPEKAYQIAKAQRNLNIGIAAYLVLILFQFIVRAQAPTMNEATAAVVGLVLGVAALVILVFVLASLFSLARRLHNVVAAIIFTILGLIPLLGLLALFGVSNTATKYLRERGYEVGLMGADLSQFARN
jgi:hypothetical protein